MTYGPFRPDENGYAFPTPQRVRLDFEAMRRLGANTVRTFTPPPRWLLDEASRANLRVVVGIPWAQHVCFLEDRDAARDARARVHRVATSIGAHPALFALLVGNETPPDVVRWERPDRVARFVGQLADTARNAAPNALVSYANFPPTEYLELDCVDFLSFNVYLERAPDLRRYLARLQNLADERPLVLTEIGLDSARAGESAQAQGLAQQLDVAFRSGVAGAFVFSFTDEWFSLDEREPEGGFFVDDWAFGLVDADRRPKPAYETVRSRFASAIPPHVEDAPLVSVVVCAFNEERTLDACLRSLRELAYPRFEVIVVDDGSTDATAAISDRYTSDHVRVIHQPNLGLSAARNRGIAEARGEVVAFTDADCVVDPAWLDYLVTKLEEGFVAVGGPNLSPAEDRLVPSVVAAAPGIPTHVLLDDDVAEHVPGCNMAFRKSALEEIGGFAERYRVAGDDVDVCWKLQDAGHLIGFSPAAVVWHHRRDHVSAYLAQQRGYGRAEALLSRDHPLRFNALGQSRWVGRVYGGLLESVWSRRPRVYHGMFGEGLFQTLYEHPGSVLRHLPLTLEWNLVAFLLLLVGLASGDVLVWAALPLGVTAGTAIVTAARARLAPAADGVPGRALLALLTYLGPLVRSVERSRARVRRTTSGTQTRPEPAPPAPRTPARLLRQNAPLAYWSENATTKAELLDAILAALERARLRVHVDSGWNPWDLEATSDVWAEARIVTAIENHGGPWRVIRVRVSVHAAPLAVGAIAACFVAAAAGLSLGVPTLTWGGALFGAVSACVVGTRHRRLRGVVTEAVDAVASERRLATIDDLDRSGSSRRERTRR